MDYYIGIRIKVKNFSELISVWIWCQAAAILDYPTCIMVTHCIVGGQLNHMFQFAAMILMSNIWCAVISSFNWRNNYI